MMRNLNYGSFTIDWDRKVRKKVLQRQMKDVLLVLNWQAKREKRKWILYAGVYSSARHSPLIKAKAKDLHQLRQKEETFGIEGDEPMED